jgi:hypothetical protein
MLDKNTSHLRKCHGVGLVQTTMIVVYFDATLGCIYNSDVKSKIWRLTFEIKNIPPQRRQ